MQTLLSLSTEYRRRVKRLLKKIVAARKAGRRGEAEKLIRYARAVGLEVEFQRGNVRELPVREATCEV